MEQRKQSGVTLIEVVVVIVILGVLAALSVPAFNGMFTDQRVKAAARSVADAFMLARAEAIRTGNTHLVVFQNAMGASDPIEIIDDGAPATANCTIDSGEVKHSVTAEDDVSWGTTASLANGTPAPDDPGGAPGSVASGSSFTDADSTPSPASWVLFQPDGLPRLFTPSGSNCDNIGQAGQGGGAIYVSNGRRDYAIVLSHLGTVRMHLWNPDAGAWRE